ncbi:MAG: hypothetical protein ACOX56_00235 [Acholeplasmataceae bacterium]|jgi:hypothetical protein
MNKVISGIKKYTPYAIMLLGIWVIVTFFIANGIKVSEPVVNPVAPDKQYEFTIFQLMFGKKLSYGGVERVYFKPNFFGFLTVISLIVGLFIATINKVNYKVRHLTASLLLLIAGIGLFVLPSRPALGNGWLNASEVIVKGGAAVIVTGTITLVFSAINFGMVFLSDKK